MHCKAAAMHINLRKMGSALATDTIPVLVTMVGPRSQSQSLPSWLVLSNGALDS